MSIIAQTTIHRVDLEAIGRPLRCSGCGWPPSKLGPAVELLSFSMPLNRGVIVDSDGGAPVTFLDELILCGGCIAEAWLLLDPHPMHTARQKVEQQKQQLANEITELTQQCTKVLGEIRGCERQIEKLRAARDEVDALRVGVGQWVVSLDAAVGPFRSARLRFWALRLTNRGKGFLADDKADAAAELAEAKERFEKSRGTLRKLTSAGERLQRQCEKNALNGEYALVQNRLAALGDLDDDEWHLSTRGG